MELFHESNNESWLILKHLAPKFANLLFDLRKHKAKTKKNNLKQKFETNHFLKRNQND